jgi:flagellin
LEKKHKRPIVSAEQEEDIMALTLGSSNATSFRNSMYLRDAKSKMDKSLMRISSGKRILSAADDPGGLALSMRLSNELTINNTIKNNVENSKSFVEMQDTALKTAGDILTEMSSLQSKYAGTTDTSDQAIYAGQYRELQAQLGSMKLERFNGVSLFSSDASTSTRIYTSTQGASGTYISLANLDIGAAVSTFGAASYSAGVTISNTNAASDLTSALGNIASLRAQSGGKLSTLGFASDFLASKSVGLEAANSRIMDADIADESINYSKYSMQYQAAAAALAQSNLTTEVVMDLLLSINKK